MPGVISAMAEAVTGDAENTAELYKMMEEGQIESRKYLLEFARILDERARQGGAYAAAVSQAAAEQMRMNNQWNDWLRILESKGFEEGQASVFRTMATFMERLNPLIEMFAENWGFAAQVIRIPLGLIGDLTSGIQRLSYSLDVSESSLLAFGAAGSMMLTKFTRKLMVFAVVLALLEDFSAFLAGRDSMFGSMFGSDVEEERARRKFIEDFEETLKSISSVTDMIAKGWQEIFRLFGDNPADGFLNAMSSILAEIRATSEAAMRVANAFGYEEPMSEKDRLRKIQEDAERPKTFFERASATLQATIRDPFGLGWGTADSDDESLSKIMEAARTTGKSGNPFTMSDEEVENSYFTSGQIYRVGGPESRIEYAPGAIQLNVTVPEGTDANGLGDVLRGEMESLLENQNKNALLRYQGGSD